MLTNEMDNDLRMVSASLSDKGLSEKRRENEDAFLELGQFGIYAVADGVGGAEGGEVASQMAIEVISEAFTHQPANSDPAEILRSSIERANAAIHQTAQEIPKLSSMATTIVALQISGNIATIAHVGDSRLYRLDPDGNLSPETEDHSMVADEVRAGRMTEEQAENHPNRNIISRALGAETTVDIDLKTITVEPGTVFMLCSDGITRHVSDDEIRGILTLAGDPVNVCEDLRKLCYERGAEDNLTAVIVKILAETGEAAANVDGQLLDDEEPTVATARSPFDSKISDDERIEIDTDEPNVTEDAEDAEQFVDTDEFPYPEKHTGENTSVETDSSAGSDVDVNGRKRPDLFGKILTTLSLLLLGVLIGLNVYHFLLVPAAAPQKTPLSEMKTEDIAMASFERLRRTVDSDPAAYIREVPPAEDAADLYLLGRAYLLTGNFANAHSTLLEAQKRLGKTDISNAKIMATDIAMALAVANDPTAQNQFRSEIENAQNTPANTSANTNINR